MLNHSVWVHVCGASGSSHFLLNSSLRLRSGRSHGANWPKDATLNLVRYQSMKQNVPQISTCPWNMLQSITNSQGASGEPKGGLLQIFFKLSMCIRNFFIPNGLRLARHPPCCPWIPNLPVNPPELFALLLPWKSRNPPWPREAWEKNGGGSVMDIPAFIVGCYGFYVVVQCVFLGFDDLLGHC